MTRKPKEAKEPEQAQDDQGSAAPADSMTPYRVPSRYIPADKQEEQRKFGKNLEGYRRHNELTMEQLSRLTRAIDPSGVGISASSLSRYERGETMPSVRELKILSFSFRTPLADLCYGSGDDPFNLQPDLNHMIQDIVWDLLVKNKLLRNTDPPGGTTEAAHEALLTQIRGKEA